MPRQIDIDNWRKANRNRSGNRTIPASRRPSKDNKPKGVKEKDKKKKVNGKEVTVRDSDVPAQVVYGQMRVGGNHTFIKTSQESAAYLITGDDGNGTTTGNKLVWTAKTTGDTGNQITITITKVPSTPNTTAFCVGNAISIALRTDASNNVLSTLANVIGAVAANAGANALVTVQKQNVNHSGKPDSIAQTNLGYGGGRWLHHFITIAGHEITNVAELYLDGRQVTFGASPDPRWGTGIWANKVFLTYTTGADSQVGQPDLIGQLPTLWTTDHAQKGWAGVYLITVWDEALFPEGFPEIEFLVGGAPVVDPRIPGNGRVFTRNGAMLVYDFLTNPNYGFGIDPSRIDSSAYIAACNICDEVLTLASGALEKRYEINGVFDVGDREGTLRQLEQAIAGRVIEQGGVYYIYAGGHRTPTLTFGPDDLRDEISLKTHVDTDQAFNAVKGTHVSIAANWNVTDFPAIKNASYLAEDGRELYTDLELNFVLSDSQCQRIAKIELEQNRQGQTLRWPGKMSCFKARVWDTVYINFPRWGITNKIYQVEEMNFVMGPDGALGTDLILRETAAAVWDWNSGFETVGDVAPNTTLPSPTDADEPVLAVPLSGTAQLYIRVDGTVQTRVKLTWTPSPSEFVAIGGSYQMQFKRSADSGWLPLPEVSGDQTSTYVTDVQDGIQYDFRIRAKNTLGYFSNWVTQSNHLVIGKTASPSDVSNFAASRTDFGIVFTWDAIPDADRDEYEIRVGANYNSGTFVWRGKGTTARWDQKATGTYNFWIKAYDTSKLGSINATMSQLVIIAPLAPSVSAQISGPNILLSWIPPTSQFAIREYEIRFGASYAAGQAIATVTANDYTHRADFGGSRTFWVAARDIAGNTGTPASVTVIISNPNPVQGFQVSAVKNTVLLNWDEPVASTLPIDYYRVYKGATYVAAVPIGRVASTFNTYLEKLGGTFTYYVEAVDTAGNVGTYQTGSGTVTQPSDFFIQSQLNLLTTTPTLVNAQSVLPNPDALVGDIYFPIAQTSGASLPILINQVTANESVDAWFTANGWTTLQDAVTAGYDSPFLAPVSMAPGYIEWIYDYGVTFASSFIDFTYVLQNIGDPLTMVTSISTSPDGVTYSTPVVGAQLFADNFRYVKYRLAFTATTNKSFAKLSSAQAILSVKRETEFIIVNCVAADVGGTTFTFTKTFLDIEDIQGTPWGTTFGVPVVDFTDVPSPTGGKVLLFNDSGTRISGQVRVQATGAVQP